MKSLATTRFWRLYQQLPNDVQTLAVKCYRLWVSNPSHPSLRFRRLAGHDRVVTVRIGDRYRALGLLDTDAVTWIWIGSHAEYDQLLRGPLR